MRDLNVKQIEALTEPRTYRVSKSLYLQIGPTGTKAWLFRYTKDGRAHGMGLGPLDLVTLAEARDRTLTCRKLLLDGIDPLEERRGKRLQTRLAAAGKITFHSCAERYIDAHAAGWRNRKHRQQWTNTLTTYAYPAIGDLPVGAIDTGLIMKIIEPIWRTKTETASRLRGRIESILDWAKARHYRTGENPARWRGHLDQLLAARSKSCPDQPSRGAVLRQVAGVHDTVAPAQRRCGAVSGIHDPDRGPLRRDARRELVRVRSGRAHLDGTGRADQGRQGAHGAAQRARPDDPRGIPPLWRLPLLERTSRATRWAAWL